MLELDPEGVRGSRMIRRRWLALAIAGGLLVMLAIFLRGLIYDVIILPLAYLWWIIGFYYSALPQWVVWTVLVALLCLAAVWNLIPDPSPARRKPLPGRNSEGPVQSLASGIARTRDGYYFKWQLANRLGRIDRGLSDAPGEPGLKGAAAIEAYVDAGLNHSFADFPPRRWLERPASTPLDLDPEAVVEYLESKMENHRGRSA